MALQIALTLDKRGVQNWVSLEQWGLNPTEIVSLLQVAKNKIDRAEEPITGALRNKRIRIGIFPLVFLGDDPRAKRSHHVGETTNASFLGAFARLALRSIKEEYDFEYETIDSLSELYPHRGDGPAHVVKVGVFGNLARERGEFAHIPCPGWRYAFACVGPDVEKTRRASEQRRVFSGNTLDFLYLSVEDSSPASYLRAMFGRTLPHKLLHCNFSPEDIAAAFAAELSEAKLQSDANHPVPLLFIDEAMADEVARHVAEQYSEALGGGPLQFVDLLGHLPEAPTVPVSFQIPRSDEDLLHLLKRAVFDEHSGPGAIFTVGAFATARTYARALVWILSQYRYDLDGGPGALARESLLSRLHAYFQRVSVHGADGAGVHAPRIPGFCRFWSFDQRALPPIEFVHLLADELVSRLIPAERYQAAVHKATDNGDALKHVLRLFFPPDWQRIVDDSWTTTRFGPKRVPMPGPQDDWKDGPASND